MVKQILVGIALGLLAASPGWSQTTSPSVIAIPPQPSWSELTTQQKIVLAPLCDEWDSFEPFRKKKWLSITARFRSMTPEEQRRTQGQMQQWRRLTPEQRRLARENFRATSQWTAAERRRLKEKWEEYSRLSDAEKKKLTNEAPESWRAPLITLPITSSLTRRNPPGALLLAPRNKTLQTSPLPTVPSPTQGID